MIMAVQRFLTPEGAEMVVLPAKDFDRLALLAPDGEDVAEARSTLAAALEAPVWALEGVG